MDIKFESNNEDEEFLDEECYSAVFESDPENVNEESVDVEDYEAVLDRGMEVTTETTNVRTGETVLKLDKATQTYENEFPEMMMISRGSLAPIIISSLNNLSNAIAPVFSEECFNNSNVHIKEITEGSLDDSVCSNATTVDTKEHILTSQSTLNLINNTSNVLNKNKDISAKKLENNSSKSKPIDIKKDHERNTTSASTVKKTQGCNNSQNFEKRPWRQPRTYQSHRAHPYQYPHHNNFYNNPPQNYYNGYHNNYYNHYDNRQGWHVQNYNYQFKERLFHGFVRFMDYVFPNNFSNDEY